MIFSTLLLLLLLKKEFGTVGASKLGLLGWGTVLEYCGINSSQTVVKHTCGCNRRKPQAGLSVDTVVLVSPDVQETQPGSLQILGLLRVGHFKAEGRAQCVHCC